MQDLNAAAAGGQALVITPFVNSGIHLILNAIAKLEKNMDRRFAVLTNGQRGAGPFDEVRFPDGTLPSQALVAPAASPRGALPPIHDVEDIRQLSAEDAGFYLQYHGQDQGPNGALLRRRRVAMLVGCLVELW
ncbi:hypothetical protein DFH06DRAFT_1327999 [Mycena polygramma]|nr:hypothetical protein DFH06DRAFT_1327999 [Mycena polygramma]